MSISIINSSTEERPVYWEYTKNDIMGRHPTMANLNYDPYPEAKGNDVVRTEIIGRELCLRAKIKAPFGWLDGGKILEFQGHRFLIKKMTEHLDLEGGGSTYEIEEATSPLTPVEPIKDLARLRAFLARP